MCRWEMSFDCVTKKFVQARRQFTTSMRIRACCANDKQFAVIDDGRGSWVQQVIQHSSVLVGIQDVGPRETKCLGAPH